MRRRTFLHQTALAGAAVSLRPSALAPQPAPGPVVVSTWDNAAANAAAWAVLQSGGYALDAVEQGVWIPEADPNDTSVGLGGLPDRDGKVTLDACIMDERGGCGSVAALEDILHPISVARRVMEQTPHVLLVGEGARQFALDQGFEPVNLLTPAAEAAWQRWKAQNRYEPPVPNSERRDLPRRNGPYPSDPFGFEDQHDTIGMIANDASGRLAGACTTSGWGFKMRGRVGDSPIVGAGLFVDSEAGAATATGHGEEMIRTAASHSVVEAMRHGLSPQDAVRTVVERIRRKMLADPSTRQAGLLALSSDGRVGGFALQPGFRYVVTVTVGAARPFEAGHVVREVTANGSTTYLVDAPALLG
ncbi:MAG: N(4)-(beta-N-acetylglucosaminyl)-L-asparaginase [Rhodothermales bacterium]|nr:N(4)-(beta-N-acetylglucosaminyl)-L-asparaginase [Rhodothermales bacterium]